MARVFIDGFENGNLNLWDADSVGTIEANTSMKSNYRYGYSPWYDNEMQAYVLKKTLPNASEYYVSFWANFGTYGIDYTTLNFYNTYNNFKLFSLVRSSSQLLKAYTNTTLRQTGAKPILNSGTYNIQVYFKVHDTNGRIVVKVDDYIDIDYIGNTVESGFLTMNKMVFSNTNNNGIRYDNIVVDDAEFPGVSIIKSLPITGNSSVEFSRSTGTSNVALINEFGVTPTVVTDTNYVYTSATTATDLYTISTANLGNPIKCVQVHASGAFIGSSPTTAMKLVIQNNSGSAVTTPMAVNYLQYTTNYKIWQNNISSQPWGISDFTNFKVGIKSV